MDSIQNTKRQIKKLHMDLGFGTNNQKRQSAISDAIKIVKKFSATIEYFRLDCASIEMSDLLDILSSLPNVKHLVLTNVFNKQPFQTAYYSSNADIEDLPLRQLKTLVLNRCDKEFRVVLDRLPVGVLNEFTIEVTRLDLESLTRLFTRQANIKLLRLIPNYFLDSAPPPVFESIFDNLKLESLDLYLDKYNRDHATIFPKQSKLKSLSLRGGVADDVLVNAITNELTELESLHVSLADETSTYNIAKLKKLKDLTIRDCSSEHIAAFAKLDNSRITVLNIGTTTIPTDLIGALAKSVPNLKVFRFGCFSTYEMFSAIIQNFNFIENLEILYENGIDLTDNTMLTRCFNPKLTKLRIYRRYDCEESFAEKLIILYPNLKKLEIYSSLTITSSHLQVISNGFVKMNSLKLWCRRWILNSLDCLRDHNGLKSLSLVNLTHFEAAEIKEKFSGVFDNINYVDEYLLYMCNGKINRLFVPPLTIF